MKTTHRSYRPEWPAGRQSIQECARARLGVEVDKRARQSMIRRVRKGDIRYARRLTHSRTVIVLEHEGRELAFLYCSANQEILCFLALDAPEVAEWAERQAAPAKPVRRPCFRVEGAHR